MLCYNSFEFFFWRKCSTVVAVGVPDFFLPAGACPAELPVINLQAKPDR